MKIYRVNMNVTVGYSVLVDADNEDEAKLTAEMQANYLLSQGLGCYVDFLDVTEVKK